LVGAEAGAAAHGRGLAIGHVVATAADRGLISHSSIIAAATQRRSDPFGHVLPAPQDRRSITCRPVTKATAYVSNACSPPCIHNHGSRLPCTTCTSNKPPIETIRHLLRSRTPSAPLPMLHRPEAGVKAQLESKSRTRGPTSRAGVRGPLRTSRPRPHTRRSSAAGADASAAPPGARRHGSSRSRREPVGPPARRRPTRIGRREGP